MNLFQPSRSDRITTPDLNQANREAQSSGLASLEQRLGPLYVAQRLGIERDHEVDRLRGRHLLDLDNRYSERLIRAALRATGLYVRGRRNALSIEVRSHEVVIANVPASFDGFTILQLSDLHIDMTADFVDALIDTIAPLRYDLCVLTGDYRARTFGPHDAAVEGMRQLRPHICGATYAVLGNHDTLRMVPAMEEMGYRFLINEHGEVERGGDALYLAGIDDAHLYRLDDCHRAAQSIPRDGNCCSILLSHTPETYRDAADAGFNLMLCGHTHGGQICLPGGFPLLTETASPRQFAKGSWRYRNMIGYTSVGAGTCLVDVRLNCRPEVTLHRLRRPEQ